MTNTVWDSPAIGYKPDPFSQEMFLEFQSLFAGTFVERRSIETHSLNVRLTMRQESDCFLLPRKTILVVSHASRCNSWSFIPRKRLTRPMGWVLHTCTYVGNLPIDIPLFSKSAPAVGPQSVRRENICKMWRALGAHLAARPGRTATLQKRDSSPLRQMPIRENVAGVWSSRLWSSVRYSLYRVSSFIYSPCGRKVSEREWKGPILLSFLFQLNL